MRCRDGLLVLIVTTEENSVVDCSNISLLPRQTNDAASHLSVTNLIFRFQQRGYGDASHRRGTTQDRYSPFKVLRQRTFTAMYRLNSNVVRHCSSFDCRPLCDVWSCCITYRRSTLRCARFWFVKSVANDDSRLVSSWPSPCLGTTVTIKVACYSTDHLQINRDDHQHIFHQAVGGLCVVLMPLVTNDVKIERKLLDAALGFAAGVMLAASYWSLLEPAVEMSRESDLYGEVRTQQPIQYAQRSYNCMTNVAESMHGFHRRSDSGWELCSSLRATAIAGAPMASSDVDALVVDGCDGVLVRSPVDAAMTRARNRTK